MRGLPMRLASVLVMVLIGGLCTSLGADAVPGSATTAPERVRPRLVDPHPCPNLDRATCAYLEVPLDRRGSVPDRLRLKVAMADNVAAPRGVLLLLTGGPGQPGVPFFGPLREPLAGALTDYRLVMIDQRGTGETAIQCPQLQREVGSSDVRAASPEAVRTCADGVGARRNFYTTADTVADLDDLRSALGVRSWTLDGVSYGTFVAQQYALTHPWRVRKLVLDSVVQQDNADPLYVAALGRSGTVLRIACREQACPSDPARDLAEALRRTGRTIDMLDMLIVLSIIDPKLNNPQFRLLDRLRAAGTGDVGPINGLLDGFSGPDTTPPELYSSGLHLATLCADFLDMPWGDSSAPLGGRDRAVRRAVARAPAEATWPFPKEVAGEQGFVANCRHWPPSRPMPRPWFNRVIAPTLLLNGDRDLSTPVEWAEEQQARMPNGKLVVIPGGGHSLQRRSPEAAREAVNFLLS